MSLFSSKSKSTTTGTTAPTNPKPVTDSIIDFTKLISSLGTRDPNQFVTGPSNLQNAAFGMGAGIAQRYGIGVPQGQSQGQMPGKPQINQLPTNVNTPEGQMSQQMGKPQYSQNTAASMYDSPGVTSSLPISGGQSMGGQSTGGLYGQAGVVPERQYDYQGYMDANPDVMQAYNAKIVTPKEQANLRAVGADYDNNGQVDAEEFGRYHYERHGKGEGRALTQLGGQMGGGQAPQGGGGFQGGQGFSGVSAAPGVGYTAAQMGQNPNDVYRDATDMARGAGMAGPNRGQLANLGEANTYGASGPANVGGYDAATIGEAERVRMGPVSQAAASQGIQFSQPYENRYTDNVVNTTLANMDEMSGRLRAQEAAAAARNNAFGGSRFGVQRALTEEQIARERASQEAGLRFGAQDRAFGLGMQDAGMSTQVSQANAAAANQMAQAQAMMDQQRLMANMDARNQAGMFGADARNRAAMDFTGRTDQASQFGAGAQNQFDLSQFGAANNMSQFNAGMDESSLMRALAASGQMGQLAGAQSGNERADLQMLSALGADERGINQQGATADLQLMNMMAQLYGTMPYNLFTGQNTSGTQTVRNTPSAFESYLAFQSAGADAAKKSIAPTG